MSHSAVRVRELAAWGLDDYPYRPDSLAAAQRFPPVAERSNPEASALVQHQSASIADLLDAQSTRSDLLEEMHGLHWTLGIIDLRKLIAFQRRLFFNPAIAAADIPDANNWEALTALTFRQTETPHYTSEIDITDGSIVIESTNPNLHVRTSTVPGNPLRIHPGGPFLEVASYRNRWFLRDGYHRAYALLCAGICQVPSVIVHARSIQELGAIQPWFFPEDILFSDDPPRFADFLNDAVVLQYSRPPLTKTIRITIQETLSPASHTGDRI